MDGRSDEQRHKNFKPKGNCATEILMILCGNGTRKIVGNQKRITGKHIQQTALRLAKELGYERFSASRGWLTSWQKRHNVLMKSSAAHADKTENKD